MVNIQGLIKESIIKAIKDNYNQEVNEEQIQLQNTRKDFKGDITIVVFPLLRYTKKSPELTGDILGQHLVSKLEEIIEFNVIKGFLNLTISPSYWISVFNHIISMDNYGMETLDKDSKTVVVEYSSPNTNKPLHLGHIRNNLLGYSISNILHAKGNKIIKTNIVNDRGIHVCKSMIAWQRWSGGETPENSGKKGDLLVGKYYVRFDQEYKKEVEELISHEMDEEEAKKSAPLIIEAQEMLRKWEAGDNEIIGLWKRMNEWVYKGFDETYEKLGVDFDKIYYESDTYKLGKKYVLEGLKKGVFLQKEDGSVWVDLTSDGLDKKILLRSDGTSVYMTQDIGTAKQRFDDFLFEKHIYVVGNEQDYHFQVLPLIMKKLGYKWADNLLHLSYGMVELPEGKMKSREGTVVDADDLIEEMLVTAKEMSEELGKLEDYSEEEKKNIYRIIGLGALKYFILKVDPRKNMLFNPRESIDFNGNTGPFIQYTYARIQSVLKKAKDVGLEPSDNFNISLVINNKEVELLKLLYELPIVIKESADTLNPALVANYVYGLTKEYNQYYHDFPIIKESDYDLRHFRLTLSKYIGNVIESAMAMLGIEVPDRM